MDTFVLAFDPGQVTGWSRWWMNEATPLSRLDYGLIADGWTGVIDWCVAHHRWVGDSVIVAEGFLPEKLAVDYRTPLRIEGALLAVCNVYAVPPPCFQSRATKRAVTDAVLKAEGLWLTGSDPKIAWTDARDVNDSQLHALAWAKHEGHLPTIVRYWPDTESVS